jgi:hypothetical protein
MQVVSAVSTRKPHDVSHGPDYAQQQLPSTRSSKPFKLFDACVSRSDLPRKAKSASLLDAVLSMTLTAFVIPFFE